MRTRADLLPTKLKQYLPNYKVECIIRRGKDFFFPPRYENTHGWSSFLCVFGCDSPSDFAFAKSAIEVSNILLRVHRRRLSHAG